MSSHERERSSLMHSLKHSLNLTHDHCHEKEEHSGDGNKDKGKHAHTQITFVEKKLETHTKPPTDVKYLPSLGIELWETERVLPSAIEMNSQILQRTIRRVALLYNPHSGAQKGALIARKTEVLFDKSKVECLTIELKEKGQAERLCQRELDTKGIDVICLLGGDGTFHEGVNGWMKRETKERESIPLAVVPAGTGNSFALELHGNVKVRAAVEHVIRGIHCPIDVSVLEFYDGQSPIYSFNSIHWGLASRVNVTAEKLRWMGKAIRYTTASLVSVLRGEKIQAKIAFEEADGKCTEYDEEFCLVIANNIGTAAKGMKMAPEARLNDGLIDLLLVRSSNTVDLLALFKKTYDGTHTDLDFVEYRQVRMFSITPYKPTPDERGFEEIEEIIDIDGELKGSTPFKCTVIPSAVRVII